MGARHRKRKMPGRHSTSSNKCFQVWLAVICLEWYLSS